MIISNSVAGITNRIKSMISVMRQTDKPYVYWKKNRYTGSKFNEIFKNDYEIKKIPFFEIYYKNLNFFISPKKWNSPFLFLKDNDDIDKNQTNPFYDEKKNYWYKINNGFSIDYQYEKIPKSIRNEYLEIIKKIKFSDEIYKKFLNFYKENFDGSVVGIQIRTWADDHRRQKMFDLSKYIKIIKSFGENQKIFVTTDNFDTINILKKNTKSKIIYFSNEEQDLSPNDTNKNNKEFAINAVIELLLLSRCKKIYASYLSNFPEVAWWLGNCEAKVVIVNPYNYDGHSQIK